MKVPCFLYRRRSVWVPCVVLIWDLRFLACFSLFCGCLRVEDDFRAQLSFLREQISLFAFWRRILLGASLYQSKKRKPQSQNSRKVVVVDLSSSSYDSNYVTRDELMTNFHCSESLLIGNHQESFSMKTNYGIGFQFQAAFIRKRFPGLVVYVEE